MPVFAHLFAQVMCLRREFRCRGQAGLFWLYLMEQYYPKEKAKTIWRSRNRNGTYINSNFQVVIAVNEFNEYVRECFSKAGGIVIRSMMGGYLVYLNGKLIGDICGKELFLKRTPTSDRLLADSELRYPYDGSKTLMHVFDKFEDADLIEELLEGMYAELPEKKPKKVKCD